MSITERKVSADERRRKEKESREKSRACFDRELTHIRMGDWRRTWGTRVELVGRVRDLHGSVCTCCPGSVYYQEDVA